MKSESLTNKLNIKKLNILQVIAVYYRSLKHDFPSSERRPLILIINGMLNGSYECLGAYDQSEMVGYAFFLKHGNDYLWDYLAVFKKYRCNGAGTAIVQAIKENYKTADSVIGEVENPEFADNDEARKLMSRRLDFYLRNGCLDTGVRAVTFGVHFIIIQITGKHMDTSHLAELYQMHYRTSLPRHIYNGNIKTF